MTKASPNASDPYTTYNPPVCVGLALVPRGSLWVHGVLHWVHGGSQGLDTNILASAMRKSRVGGFLTVGANASSRRL